MIRKVLEKKSKEELLLIVNKIIDNIEEWEKILLNLKDDNIYDIINNCEDDNEEEY